MFRYMPLRINQVMKEIVPEEKPNSITPKLGEVGYLNVGLSVLIGVAVLEYMRMSGIGDVSWYNDLISSLLGQ
jgi:hypothetical protein